MRYVASGKTTLGAAALRMTRLILDGLMLVVVSVPCVVRLVRLVAALLGVVTRCRWTLACLVTYLLSALMRDLTLVPARTCLGRRSLALVTCVQANGALGLVWLCLWACVVWK